MNHINIKDIHKRYNRGTSSEVYALRGIDLTCSKGDMAAIIGVSGSGKSTLMHVIGCIDVFDCGSYTLGDIDIGSLTLKEKAHIRNKKMGFILQQYGLLNEEKAWENVAIPLRIAKYKSAVVKNKAFEALDDVGLGDLVNKKVKEMSGGQKQRVAIARAIANNPDIILADEPTGALDTKTSQNIMDLFVQLNKRNKTVIIVTHDPLVTGYCKRTIKISDGIILEETEQQQKYV